MNENTGPDVQIIENASLDDVRPGDHVVWEKTWVVRGVTCAEIREDVAHHLDSAGDWCNEDGMWITGGEGEGITLTIRRPVPVGQEPGR